MKNSDTPAYPVDTNGEPIHPKQFIGLTKREHFTAMAMQGLMGTTESGYFGGHTNIEESCKYCIEVADELLKQLEK